MDFGNWYAIIPLVMEDSLPTASVAVPRKTLRMRAGTDQRSVPLRSVSDADTEEPIGTWFEREILGHEEALTRFLLRVWFRKDEIRDVRQEAYLRVYEAAQKARPRMPKAFLFATARNLLADQVRRARVVCIETWGHRLEPFAGLVDAISPEQRVSARTELTELFGTIACLTMRCREVLWLRRVEGLSQREVAERLGISEKTVEKHLSVAMRKLAQFR